MFDAVLYCVVLKKQGVESSHWLVYLHEYDLAETVLSGLTKAIAICKIIMMFIS